MTKLRQDFIDHLQLKGFSAKTIRNYIDCVSHYSKHFGVSPLKLTNTHAKEFLLYLRNDRKLYSLKGFYRAFQPDLDVMRDIGRMKEPIKRPEILSRQEVEALIAASTNLKVKAINAVLYSSGIRLNECVNLKITDVDSSRMVLRIVNGKGGRDRFAVLSQRTLDILREYVKKYRPTTYLFEGHYKNRPLTSRRFQEYVVMSGKRAGLSKHVTPHLLRHTFATHQLEGGVALKVIQDLLGHATIRTTAEYTHVSNAMLKSAGSPFDQPLPKTGGHL
jgi:integrase/recombinase XerD